MHWQRRFLTFNTWLALVENEWINPVQSGTEETKWKTQKRSKCDPRPCTVSAVTPSLGTNLEHLQPCWNSISWSLVGCIFDTNDKISHFTEKWGHVCLLLEGLVFFFDKQDSLCFCYCCSMSLVSHIQVCSFNNQESPAVSVYNRARPVAEPAFHIFGLFSQMLQLSTTSRATSTNNCATSRPTVDWH